MDEEDPQKKFGAELRFGYWNRLPIIVQTETSECGLACLAMVAGFYGHSIDLIEARQRFSIGRGVTLKGLVGIASEMNFAARPLRLELDELVQLRVPCILHWDLNHFVVLKKVSERGQRIVIHDPARGICKLRLSEVSRHFTGVALELTPTSSFSPQRRKIRFELRKLVGQVVGLKRSLGQILALALILEVFSLIAPFFMQWVVDGAISDSNISLLAMLVVAFGLLTLIQTAIGLMRTWMVMYMSIHLSLQWTANVLTHLLRLPMSYFEKRHLGDITSRFGAIESIQRLVTTSFIETILDGLLATAAFGMMLAYSKSLSGLVFVSLLIYGLLRWISYAPFRQASEQQVILQARQQSIFLETLRGIQSLKLYNKEEERHSYWLNATIKSTNRNIATQYMSMTFGLGHTLVSSAESLLIIWFGAQMVMKGEFTIGMLYAFISFKTTFTGRLYSLIDKGIDLKMLSIQSDRLSDILLTRKEGVAQTDEEDDVLNRSMGFGLNTVLGVNQRRRPATFYDKVILEARDLSFRYSDNEAWILRNVNFTIEDGESIAFSGHSGCGKTTLIKLLVGLLEPSEGGIFLNDVPLSQIGTKAYRDIIGTVMQEDQLFSGSIAENISFFAADSDLEWIENCAKMAGIAPEISVMPMAYQTRLGDMGSNLSGGQRQRVLLARALYKRPKILFLDEATSHLDVKNERIINNVIKSLPLTRILIAHRPETMESASRLLEIRNGTIFQDVEVDQSLILY